jgi:hypothetical protein
MRNRERTLRDSLVAPIASPGTINAGQQATSTYA